MYNIVNSESIQYNKYNQNTISDKDSISEEFKF